MQATFALLHLGVKAFPGYGYDCIEQIRLFNARERIFLVLDDECSHVDLERLARSRCELVRRSELRPTLKHRFYRASNLLRFKGLGGFWLYATERFFLIEELMRKFRLSDLVHLENDVMLYLELGRALPILRTLYPELAIVRDHDGRCIAGFLYARSVLGISRLNAYISFNLLSRRRNDMMLLSSYSRYRHTMQLPLVAPSYAERFGLVNLRGQRPRDAASYSRDFGALGSAFDAASFGQFVGGIDKIHSSGDTRGFVNETSYVNPAMGDVAWRKDAEGRWAPIFTYAGTEVPLANLHIHSKELSLYRSDRVGE